MNSEISQEMIGDAIGESWKSVRTLREFMLNKSYLRFENGLIVRLQRGLSLFYRQG